MNKKKLIWRSFFVILVLGYLVSTFYLISFHNQNDKKFQTLLSGIRSHMSECKSFKITENDATLFDKGFYYFGFQWEADFLKDQIIIGTSLILYLIGSVLVLNKKNKLLQKRISESCAEKRNQLLI